MNTQRDAFRLRIGIVGLGKAGSALRRSLRAADVRITQAVRRAHQLTRPCDLVFLAVPDDVIHQVSLELSSRAHGAVVHLSGSRGTDVFDSDSTAKGAFHPLASLQRAHAIPHGTLIAFDGTTPALRRHLQKLARAVGGKPVRIQNAQRVAYHAGAVVAGNLPVALLDHGMKLLMHSGVPETVARQALAHLLLTQAHNALRQPLQQALTGPVARGDSATLKKHLAVLDADAPETALVYRHLSTTLVDIAAHPRRVAAALRQALASPSDDVG